MSRGKADEPAWLDRAGTDEQDEDWLDRGIALEELIHWAEFLVVAPMTADSIAKMLHGLVDNTLQRILRSWDVSKKILVVPGMSVLMWENPMTRQQLSKIAHNWNWIRVLDPLLRTCAKESQSEQKLNEDRLFNEVIQIVQNQADLLTLGNDMDTAPSTLSTTKSWNQPCNVFLPPEILSVIFEYFGDWEIAACLGVKTMLPTPQDWREPTHEGLDQSRSLEWTILTGRLPHFINHLKSNPPLKWLSKLSVKLIIKLGRTDILSYLETHDRELFRSTFAHKLLPNKASSVFGRLEILDWWSTSPSFLHKEYDNEAIDGASKAGFVFVLDWWRASKLPLHYTEAALEQAASKGHIAVLEWWRNKVAEGREHGTRSRLSGQNNSSNDLEEQRPLDSESPSMKPIRLKIGKSLILAAQNGQDGVLSWWTAASLPTPHKDSIARTASAFGHVNVLNTWKAIEGDKMQFDNQVLVGATRNGHDKVLEWWKNCGYRVEYKTCDIEEALEDCLGGEGENRVRGWWARNGLNLGVGTSEWMQVKAL